MTCDYCGLPDSYLLHIEHAEPDTLSATQCKVLAIQRDLTDRGGLDNAWESIDSEIIEEILREWVRIIDNPATHSTEAVMS